MTAPTALLRPALEAAVQVARAGEAADPAQPAPQALRRFLRFARLPAPALDIARKVLDEDVEFRQRVASQLSQSDVGEAGWLWLTRPDGWEQRVEHLRQKQAEAEHHEREERAERDAQRRLSFAEDRARRAEALVSVRAKEADEARAALAHVRAQAQQLAADLEHARAQLAELRDQRNHAVRQLKDVEGELARRTAELRQARHEIRMREAELAAEPPAATAAAPAPVTAGETAPAPAAEAIDRQAISHAVRRAAGAADELSRALAAASALLAPAESDAPAAPPPVAAAPATPAVPARPRRAVRLPAGVLDDSAAAADYLLRTPDVRLLVDGYNVSKEAWPHLPIALQRSRLVDALTELQARCGAEVDVVFDSTETDLPPRPATRATVRVRFSPNRVEADDVLLELVDHTPSERHVVVASSDKRVRDGALERGANVLGSRQLLAAIGR